MADKLYSSATIWASTMEDYHLARRELEREDYFFPFTFTADVLGGVS